MSRTGTPTRDYVADAKLNPKGYQQITGLSAVKGLNPPQGARVAVICCWSQPVRWRDDGTDPDANTGMPMMAGRDMLYTGNLAKIKFIEMNTGAELNVSYYD